MKFLNDSDKRPTGYDLKGKSLTKPTPATVDIHRTGLGRIYCKPGEIVEVPDWAAKPQRGANNGRVPSVIENLCPQLRPADPKELEVWKDVPPPPAPRGKAAAQEIPGVEELIAGGMPPAAARAKVSRMLAERSLEEQAEEDKE